MNDEKEAMLWTRGLPRGDLDNLNNGVQLSSGLPGRFLE